MIKANPPVGSAYIQCGSDNIPLKFMSVIHNVAPRNMTENPIVPVCSDGICVLQILLISSAKI